MSSQTHNFYDVVQIYIHWSQLSANCYDEIAIMCISYGFKINFLYLDRRNIVCVRSARWSSHDS